MSLQPQAALVKLLGASAMQVSRAIKQRKVASGVVFDDRGKFLGISDLEAAAADYRKFVAAKTVVTVAVPVAGGAPVEGEAEENSLQNAGNRAKHWDAELKRLKFEEAEGGLVRAADVQAEWVDLLSQVRTRLLAIPTLVKQAAPHLAIADLAVIETQIRQALEGLSETAPGLPA